MKENNNFKRLLSKSIKEKKNWFVLAMVVLLVTVVIIPFLSGGLKHDHITIGLIEVFIIVFINTLIDFSYLHDIKKYSYFVSKPLNKLHRFNMVILSNLIFMTILILPLIILKEVKSIYMTDMLSLAIPWMIITIFLIGLSSLLSGNTIIAGITTIFNFLLPLVIAGMFYFIMMIVENLTAGINADVLFNKFIAEIYRLDLIYFVDISFVHNTLTIIPVLFLIVFIIYIISIKLLKLRQNEKIGDFIVFKSYKNLVALLISTFIPFVFVVLFNYNNYISQFLTFIILSPISYYIVIAILEKSFKISKNSIKLVSVFISLFVIVTFTTGMIVKKYESYVPDIEDIEWAFIGNNRSASWSTEYLNVGFIKTNRFQSKEAIQGVLETQMAILENQKTDKGYNIGIVYLLKNGELLERNYILPYTYRKPSVSLKLEDINKKLYTAVKKITVSDEFKKMKFPLFYDDSIDYSDSIYVKMRFSDGEVEVDLKSKEEIIKFKEVFKLDIDDVFNKDENVLDRVIYINSYSNTNKLDIDVESINNINGYLESVSITTFKDDKHWSYKYKFDGKDKFINTKEFFLNCNKKYKP